MRKIPLLELLLRLFPDRDRKELHALVLRGRVDVDGSPVLKPGIKVPEGSRVSLKPPRLFVSRGGEKLARALESFGVSPRGMTVLDAGSSTGGFTDCLLKNGASRVYCVDVGWGALDYGLRRDPRVVVMERTNVMSLTPPDFSPRPDIAVADLSFRSLRKAARHILDLTVEGRGIFLAKPQFEWENPPPEFKGVVEGEEDLRGILTELIRGLEGEGVHALDGVSSPITGRKGNREFLLLLQSSAGAAAEVEELLKSLLGE